MGRGDAGGVLDEKFSWIGVFCAVATMACAQDAAPTPGAPASAAELEALRPQVQALTETVKTLQQQVKDQQARPPRENLRRRAGFAAGE